MGRYNEAFEELRRTDDLAYGFFLVQTEAYMCEQFLSGVIDAEVLKLLRLLQRLRDSGASHSEQATAIRWRWRMKSNLDVAQCGLPPGRS